MIRHKLPVNVYQYMATIAGIPLREVLALAIIVCISLLLTRINILLSLIFLSVTLIMFLLSLKGHRLISKVPSPTLGKKENYVVLKAEFHNFNGQLFLKSGNILYLYFQVSTRDLLAMREESQVTIVNGISESLNHLGHKVEFLSLHNREEEGDSFPPYYTFQSFMRISANIKGLKMEKAAAALASEAREIDRYFTSSELTLQAITSKAILSEILSRNIGASLSQVGSSGNHDNDKFSAKFHLRRFRNFAKTARYYSDLAVVNSTYSSGPFYQTLLEGMKIPFDISISMVGVRSGNPLQYVSRLLAERKTEYRFTHGMSKETDYLRNQVADLEAIKMDLEKNGVKIFDVFMTLRIYATHPAILNQRMERISSALKALGIKTAREKPQEFRELKSLDPFPQRRRYLMDSRSIAGILPIYRNPFGNRNGIVLGIDDLSERIVDYHPFSQNSYNSLVIGETGSGKSYFAKMFLMRSLESAAADKAVIFDPLNEYTCALFGSDCDEYSLNDYIDEDISERAQLQLNHGNNSYPPRVKIIKPVFKELDDDAAIGELLKALNREMSQKRNKGLLLVLDECHIILRDLNNAKLLGSMVRHSRHYKTSIINISQNTDDFLSRVSSSIAYNSHRIFLFRTRNLNDSHKKVLKIDGFDIPRPENLAGGNKNSYSECIVSDGTYCRTLRVITSSDEDAALRDSV